AVTKKPRLRLMMRRSSSVRPFGSFQVAMSRDMLISCGIQWLEQVASYFSHAHLYLNGTSWLTSVWPLMMRLSAAFTRRLAGGATIAASGAEARRSRPTVARVGAAEANAAGAMRVADARVCGWLAVLACAGLTSSSQTSIVEFPVFRIMRVLRRKPKHLLTF